MTPARALPPGIIPAEADLLIALLDARDVGEPTTTMYLARRLGWTRTRTLTALHDLRDRNRVANHRDEDGAPLGWAPVCWTCDGDGAVFRGSVESICPSCNGQGPIPEGVSVPSNVGRRPHREAAAVTVLTTLDDQGPAGVVDLSAQLGWSAESTRYLLRELIAEGQIVREGRVYFRSHRAGRSGPDVREASATRAPTTAGRPALADRGIGEGSAARRPRRGASC